MKQKMTIQIANVEDTMFDSSYLVRGLLSDGNAALVRVCRDVALKDVSETARPLLVEQFAIGNYYKTGENRAICSTVHATLSVQPTRAVRVVSDGENNPPLEVE